MLISLFLSTALAAPALTDVGGGCGGCAVSGSPGLAAGVAVLAALLAVGRRAR